MKVLIFLQSRVRLFSQVTIIIVNLFKGEVEYYAFTMMELQKKIKQIYMM